MRVWVIIFKDFDRTSKVLISAYDEKQARKKALKKHTEQVGAYNVKHFRFSKVIRSYLYDVNITKL